MITIELDPKYHIWEAALTRDERPILKGVYIHKDGYMIATNGFILACIPCNINIDEDEVFENCIVPADIFKKVNGKRELNINLKEKTVKLFIDKNLNSYIGSSLIEGKYPEYNHIIPSLDDLEPINHINLNYALYTSLCKAIGSDYPYLMFTKQNSSVLVVNPEDKAFGLIMPVILKKLNEEILTYITNFSKDKNE